jgi:hypothetical protein
MEVFVFDGRSQVRRQALSTDRGLLTGSLLRKQTPDPGTASVPEEVKERFQGCGRWADSDYQAVGGSSMLEP